MMSKNFLDFEFQIELNEKNLDKYHSLFEATMGKISLISLTYSIIAIYTVQFIAFILKSPKQNFIFILSLISLLILVIISIFFTIKFMIPVKLSHLHSPKLNLKQPQSNDVINKYIQATYLSEIEEAVENNYLAFKTKRRLFYFAFNFSLLSFIPYLICLSMYLTKKNESSPSKIEVVNFDYFLQKIDSISQKRLNLDSNSVYELRSQK
jgi:hypothetical protein